MLNWGIPLSLSFTFQLSHSHQTAAVKLYDPVQIMLPSRHVTAKMQPAVINGFSFSCQSFIPNVLHLEK